MDTIKLKQIKVIKAGIYNDRIYTDKDNCVSKLVNPIMGKSLSDIEFIDKRKPDIRKSSYITTKGKLFELWRIGGEEAQTMYIITVDGKIYYYTFCSIFAPASSAFETLTEVYYTNHIDGSPIYGGLLPAVYFNVLWRPHPDSLRIHQVLNNVDDFVNKLYSHY